MSAEEPFDDQQAKFVQHIAEGGTWRSASKLLGVSSYSFSKWLSSDEQLAKQYARALEAQGDEYAFRVIETAEDPTIDPADKRARIDAYKWAAGKRKPKVYGDRLTHAGDENAPVRSEVSVKIDDETIERISARLLGG